MLETHEDLWDVSPGLLLSLSNMLRSGPMPDGVGGPRGDIIAATLILVLVVGDIFEKLNVELGGGVFVSRLMPAELPVWTCPVLDTTEVSGYTLLGIVI